MNKKGYFAFFIILLLLHVMIFSLIPLSDPSEARYATIGKEMAETGDYVMPHIWIQGKRIPFMGKPPFGFWMIAASVGLFGANEFACRLPSFCAASLLLIMIFLILRRTQGIYAAVSATLICATTAGFYLLSDVVLVDMWLCLFSLGAVFLYHAFIHENNAKVKKRLSLLVFLFLAGAFLTKGPVGLIFFGLPVFFWTLLSNRWDTLKHHAWVTGSVLFLLIVIPWFILAEKSVPGYLHYFFVVENVQRFISPDKSGDLYSGISHAVPKGTAIIYALMVCLPWSLILLVFFSLKEQKATALFPAIKKGLRSIKTHAFVKNKPDFDLFLTGFISVTLFWCLSSHLMPYYMVLVTPLFAVWCARLFRVYRLPVGKIIKTSIILLILYSTACIPAYFIISNRKSTKAITLRAIELRRQMGLKGKLIFVRRLEYSSYFYGGNLILPHEKEPVEKSLSHGNGNDNIYISAKRYAKRIPENLETGFEKHYQDNNWMLMTRK